MSQQDKTFVHEAGADGIAEIEPGQLAGQKAADRRCASLATDHGFANRWLEALLREEHQSAQPALTAEQKQEKQRLEGLSGAQFDQQYIQHMVQDHEKTIPLFQKEAKEGHNQAIKSFAENLTPVLDQHLAEAKELAGNNGMAAGQGTNATQRSGSSSPQR